MTGGGRPSVAARAAVVAAPGGALPVLRGEGPLALRRTRSADPAFAQVTLVGAMSAPLTGDRLELTVDVLAGAALRITSAAATLALPGRVPEPAEYRVTLRVADEATLDWAPEPLISAAGSALRQHTRVELAPTARLALREILVLGRDGEEPGRLASRLTVHRDGRPLLDQELRCGDWAPGWDGGAVLGGHRAVGQLLCVDPELAKAPAEPQRLGAGAVTVPLAGPATLTSAVAPDALELHRLLAAAGTGGSYSW
ncbi:urease accessory protein UreD [Streptomyces sp. 3MP-14]|uniref:Urease accessory protein UreD n=1 Tax=Streptomyces mimosae TaxID=2586635 RepID=A0A5N5ZUL9_9ACTN|nr:MULTISPECIES: urease accessory protein UreD [Streptomyces]KAB8159489.1 urease accessory protein UreD [Streptomyces mimosae]KAB8172623.1 urease accessory protein UreD [Streptomyces sp. 3MP-14]